MMNDFTIEFSANSIELSSVVKVQVRFVAKDRRDICDQPVRKSSFSDPSNPPMKAFDLLLCSDDINNSQMGEVRIFQ
jgi:hypothetical protein